MTDYQNPIPIVRLIIPNPKGKILILKRQNTSHAQGFCCLPGGKVDYGETVEETCRKELYEETGLECQDLRFLFYQDSLPPEPGTMHGINLYFECTAVGTVILNQEFSDFTWIGPKDIKQFNIAFRNDEALLKYWNNSTGK